MFPNCGENVMMFQTWEQSGKLENGPQHLSNQEAATLLLFNTEAKVRCSGDWSFLNCDLEMHINQTPLGLLFVFNKVYINKEADKCIEYGYDNN